MSDVEVIERGGVRDILGEGLYWSDREGAVYWTDILAPALNRLMLATGEVRRWPMPERIGWVIEREQAPGLIAGFESGFAALTLDPIEVTPIARPEPHPPGNRSNDAKADPWGRIWAGSMQVEPRQPEGHLFRLDPDGTVVLADSGYTIANGPAISPDGKWLLHTDTAAKRIYRFALDERGVSDKQLFLRFLPDWGNPDGMTFDAEGGLWVACWGGSQVVRFDTQGRLERSITLPASQITNVCFAGPELDQMFITSAADGKPDERHAGALFRVDAGVTGLAPHRFGG
jgi:xylono-1,5-lactonase